MRFPIALYALLFLFLFVTGGGAAAASGPDYREEGVTVVHVRDAHPFYFEGRNGAPRGMLVDLWTAWSLKTGIPVEFVFASWKDSLALVLDGTYDIHGGLMISKDRVNEFDFGPPLFTIASSLIGRKDDQREMKTILDVEHVGIVTAGLPGKLLKTQFPNVKVMEYDLPRQVVEAMADGRVEAVAMDVPTFHFNNIELSNPVDYKTLTVLSEKDIHAGVLKGNVELLNLVNEGFASLDEQERELIQNRWFVVSSKTETKDYTWWIVLAVALIVSSLLIARLGRYKSPLYPEDDAGGDSHREQ